MNKQTIITALLAAIFGLTSCSRDSNYEDKVDKVTKVPHPLRVVYIFDFQFVSYYAASSSSSNASAMTMYFSSIFSLRTILAESSS